MCMLYVFVYASKDMTDHSSFPGCGAAIMKASAGEKRIRRRSLVSIGVPRTMNPSADRCIEPSLLCIYRLQSPCDDIYVSGSIAFVV